MVEGGLVPMTMSGLGSERVAVTPGGVEIEIAGAINRLMPGVGWSCCARCWPW
jgi:hypothetical protein